MRIGYARVSTNDQNLDLQMYALQKAGCKRIITDQISGSKTRRPGLDELLYLLKEGDQIIVWRLDRLGRSLKDLVSLINDFDLRGAGFTSLEDHIDTSTPVGQFTFHIFVAVAQFERDIIRMRTIAGLNAPGARGRYGGRPRGLSKQSDNKALAAESLYREGKLSIAQICEQLGVSKPTVYRYLHLRGVKIRDK